MKIIDYIMDSLNLYDEEEIYDDEIEEKDGKKAETKEKHSLFKPKNTARKKEKEADDDTMPDLVLKRPEGGEQQKKSLFSFVHSGSREGKNEKMGSKTLSLPYENKQINVVVIEPANFDDSQKIADYLRGSQPVVVNFEGTDNVVAKRMTDFISGTIYALNGSMKKMGRNILICAPKNVDIDAGAPSYTERTDG